MPYIFSRPGRAAVVASEAAIPALITVLDHWGGFQKFSAILVGYGLNSASAIQFSHTLRDHIHVYAFGERVGELTINGIAFAGSCGPNELSTGLDWLVWYCRTFAAGTTGQPLTITLGAVSSFSGFLTNFSVQSTDPETGLSTFTLAFRYPPLLPTEIVDATTGKISYFFTPPPDEPTTGLTP